jgi:citryl-CoA lyase
MKFKTSITQIKDGKEIVRGEELESLIANHSFSETIYLILKGELPSKEQARMLDAILTSVIDHGPAVTSAMGARISASAKNSTHASLAAGLLSLGDRHGVALTAAMEFLYDQADVEDLEVVLKERKEKKQYVSGFGHKVFKVDPRSEALFAIAKEMGVFGKHCEFALQVEKTLNAMSSKKLPLNVDGAIGAILCDMGFDAKLGNSIFMIGRVPGLLAHIHEEQTSGEGIRRLGSDEVEFIS